MEMSRLVFRCDEEIPGIGYSAYYEGEGDYDKVQHEQCRDKIAAIETSFKKAVDWLDHTGSGIKNEDTIHAYVKRLCPYYYELEPIMIDRTNTRPLCTKETLSASSSDDSSVSGDMERTQAKTETAASTRLPCLGKGQEVMADVSETESGVEGDGGGHIQSTGEKPSKTTPSSKVSFASSRPPSIRSESKKMRHMKVND